MNSNTYADEFCDWLVAEGFTTCFFVAGGNIMHLLNSARSRFHCVPVVHEVAAGIAAEYFNMVADGQDGSKAFALVTAGPGLTNIVTAIGGAWLESRELLVVGGQVKSVDLASSDMRQRGIQEIAGISIVEPICRATLQVTRPLPGDVVMDVVRSGSQGRPGPVFIEFCLDAQASSPTGTWPSPTQSVHRGLPSKQELEAAKSLIGAATRPVLLIGGGVDRHGFSEILPKIQALSIPVATTWNGADRIAASHPNYVGRPNTWGQRSANIILQQADVVIAAGTRLGLQQTGFNWTEFAPLAKVIHIDIDEVELRKGHPRTDLALLGDAASSLRLLMDSAMPNTTWSSWLAFCRDIRSLLPLSEPANSRRSGFINPFDFAQELSAHSNEGDFIIPCSSGGAFTVMMQAYEQKADQRVITNKGAASMGYGLSGAIGAAYANPSRKVLLVEGDGGFAQNLQELGTVRESNFSIKIFIFDNDGYASIRMTQQNYFGGVHIGCDKSTGLGLPDWQTLFEAFGIPVLRLNPEAMFDAATVDLLDRPGPAAFLVPIDPDQTYFPKISSRLTAGGSMESNALHLMSPPLPRDLSDSVFRYLKGAE